VVLRYGEKWWFDREVGRLRDRVTPRALVWVNRVSGAVLLVFGLVAIGAAIGFAA